MFALDLLRAISANITCNDLLEYIAEFFVLTLLISAISLFVVLGRFRGVSILMAVAHFLSLSITVGGLALLAFLPWPVYQQAGKIEQQIIHEHLLRFEQVLCCSLDRDAQSGEYPFMLYENGQGIVLAGKVDHQYFPLLMKRAKALLPGIRIEEPPAFLPSEGMVCQQQLVRNIVDWNRNELKKALIKIVQQESEVYHCVMGVSAFVFFVLLLLLSERYGRIKAESCALLDNDI